MIFLYVIGFIAALGMAFVMTPAVRKFAFLVGAVDAPNHRKVHTRIMPRLGGLAIYLAFIGAFFIVMPVLPEYNENVVWGLIAGGTIIVLVGALDDRYELSAKKKLFGQIIAACVVVAFGLKVELVNLPFGDSVILDTLSIPITILWIVAVTNAINLIDGLDGLAAGVSSIATSIILVLAVMMGNVTVILLSTVLLGSILGFLFFNFHPAKIFMGDSGALFLGFCLATLSILGFKQATFVSLIVPLLIFGVPLGDTALAILRRRVNNLPISAADKNHLHHCLLQLGFSHRQTVLIIYAIAALFGVFAVLMSQAALWLTLVLTIVLVVMLALGAEMIGIIHKTRKPVTQFIRQLSMKTMRYISARTMK